MKFNHLFIYTLMLLQSGLRFDPCTYGAHNSASKCASALNIMKMMK